MVRRPIARRRGFRAHFSLYLPLPPEEEAGDAAGVEAGLASAVEPREPELELGWVLAGQELSPLPLRTGDAAAARRLRVLGLGDGGVRVSLLLPGAGAEGTRWGWGVGRI